MTWLFTLLAMAVIALVAGLVTGRIAGSMDPPETSLPFKGLPPDGVVPGDLEELRFDAALRGYRMSEVDEVIDRLAAELRHRDDEIAGLRAALAAHGVLGPDDERRAGSGESGPGSPADAEAGASGPFVAAGAAGVSGSIGDPSADAAIGDPPFGEAAFGEADAPDGSSGPAYAPPGGFDPRDWSDRGRD